MHLNREIVGDLVVVNQGAFNSRIAYSCGCGSDDDCGCEGGEGSCECGGDPECE